MNAEKYNLERIYFGGCFIRGGCDRPAGTLIPVADGFLGHAATIGTLSYAIRFWSNGKKRALFLRHEGFLYVPRIEF
jgi:type II pantothenate kinase